ncbi:putative outer membrane starch-binding protein [Dyadobacter jejuensis]|uniref:Putative outer membrane starch-binding protein n=1 Tax=Dyadobacter jejuensis TaxID=1082580 RepID=A0A316AJG2_9BACT|nr:RagB/SusD family nutrient uptake outer membrane protein [Dyadobacter jejuensis]PWJ57955.1 putative outer membrane starch-binding protein [Dyadobacter jejuensis]
MKNIKLLILIAALSFVGISCNDDLLNTKPLDKFSEEAVWNDINLAQGFIYNTYMSVIPELYVNPADPQSRFGGVGNDDYTDNVLIKRSNVVVRDLMDKFFDAGWAKSNAYYWWKSISPTKQNSFEAIRDCNLIIEKVAASTGIKESEKAGLIAQGKMLRALMYYSKARLFGKYVIVDHVLSEEDDFKLPRTNTIKETYDFIVKDLQEASLALPDKGAVAAGQLTKGAALAMLAEISLHGAAYIESGKTEYYQISKKASEDLIALGYTLDTDYEAMFNDYDHGLSTPEGILGLYKHINVTVGQQTMMQGLVPNMEPSATKGSPALVEQFVGWTEIWPSVSLVDDYLVVDADGEAKKWDQTSYYKTFKAQGGYVSEAIYKHRDKRFYASIVQDSTKFFNNLVTTRVGGNMHYLSSTKGFQYMTPSGYYMRKGIYEKIRFQSNLNTSYHQFITRLGRAYLNYAEVLLRLGNTSEAINYINKTRVAHGGLPELPTGLSASEAWKWYKIERRVELFFENDRYWSLLRWGMENGGNVIPEINDTQHQFMEISSDGRSFQLKELFQYKSLNEKKFTVKRYLFPVPEKERQQNENLDQNPGW